MALVNMKIGVVAGAQAAFQRVLMHVAGQLQHITDVQHPTLADWLLNFSCYVRAYLFVELMGQRPTLPVFIWMLRVCPNPAVWTAFGFSLAVIHTSIICGGSPKARANICLWLLSFFGFTGILAWDGFHVSAYALDNLVSSGGFMFLYWHLSGKYHLQHTSWFPFLFRRSDVHRRVNVVE